MNELLVNKVSHVLHDNNESLTWGDTDDLAKKVLAALGADEERHVVRISGWNYTIEHPIHERLLGSLLDCEMLPHIQTHLDPSLEDGTYYVFILDSGEFKTTKKEN